MQMALEALEQYKGVVVTHHDPESFRRMEVDGGQAARDAIAVLRAALAEPVQNEPLAWFRLDEKTNEAFLVYFPSADGKDWRPLYAMPRKPLTDEEIERVCVSLGAAMLSFTEVARAIERAHGIGEGQ